MDINQLVGKCFYDVFESSKSIIKVDSVDFERKFGVESILLKGKSIKIMEIEEEITLNCNKVYKIASVCIDELKEITLEEYNKKKAEFIDKVSKF